MRTELPVDAFKVHLQRALDETANTRATAIERQLEASVARHLVYSLQCVGCPIALRRTPEGFYAIE